MTETAILTLTSTETSTAISTEALVPRPRPLSFVLRCRGMNVAWLMDVMSRLAMATVTICVIFLLWPGSDE